MTTERMPKGIRLVLVPEVSQLTEEVAQELALTVLATALHAVKHAAAQAWTLARVKDTSQLTFILTPLPGQQVSVRNIYRLKLALCAQPNVCEVTLTF
jgi:hypothetical protein